MAIQGPNIAFGAPYTPQKPLKDRKEDFGC